MANPNDSVNFGGGFVKLKSKVRGSFYKWNEIESSISKFVLNLDNGNTDARTAEPTYAD